MNKIKYHDTNGDKSALLPKAEFGYDDYQAGGDAGRVYVGTGTENIPLAKVDDLGDLNSAVGITENIRRYDKILGSLDIIDMVYTGDNLTTARYEGDDDSTIYYRDVMSYTDGNLTDVKHFYGTTNLITASASTTLTYDVNGNLATATYTEV